MWLHQANSYILTRKEISGMPRSISDITIGHADGIGPDRTGDIIALAPGEVVPKADQNTWEKA